MTGPISYVPPKIYRVRGPSGQMHDCIAKARFYPNGKIKYRARQCYRLWFDWDTRVWMCVADDIEALCIPHVYFWAPSRYGRRAWEWIMSDEGGVRDAYAIAANGLVVGGPDESDRRCCCCWRCGQVDESKLAKRKELPKMADLKRHGIELTEVTV